VRPFALLFLLAATAQAQPIVGNEVVWRTTSAAVTYKPALQAARIAADGSGFVVAWSEVEDGVSRAYAGRLDGLGRLATIGVHTTGAADAVSIAPFRDRYIAAWVEPSSTDARPMLVTAALDRGFQLLSSRFVAVTNGTPLVRTTPTRAYVGSGTLLYEVDGGAAPIRAYDHPRTLDDLTTAGEEVAFVEHSIAVALGLCGISGVCSPGPTPKYSIGFVWLFHLSAGLTLPIQIDSLVAVSAGNDDHFLVMWAEYGTGTSVKASLFGSAFQPFVVSPHGPAAADGVIQPQIAWDGKRWVAVWTRGGAIEGAVITPSLNIIPLSISARGTRPAIATARQGRFLVTYEVVDAGQRRLASRVIELEPAGRERVVR
jgi:hypothetical protein